MTELQGLYDKRTRVTLFLPLANEKHENAICAFVEYLKSNHNRPIPITGFISSLLRPAGFSGYWWSDESNSWVEEYNMSFIIDFGLSFNSRSVPLILKELKNTIADLYKHYGSEQDEIWLIAQPVERYV